MAISATRSKQIIFFQLILFTAGIHSQKLTRRQITSYLLDPVRYDPNIVPDFDEEYPTNVCIQITIHDMHSVSEAQMEYSVDAYLRMWWRDERLDFSRNSTISKLELDSKKLDSVWQPDIFFENEKRATVHTVTTTNKLMHVLNNGTVTYSIRLSLSLTCTMVLHYFPFDSQRCPLYVQSFGYTMDNINLSWHEEKPIIFDNFEMPKFTLDENEILFIDYEHPYSETGTFSTLKAELVLNRNVGFYFLQVFIPRILLVVLSWVSFWVDPTAVPARVSLGVTCVLTMTTQSSGIRQTLPPVSYVKAIDVWMFVCLLFVFAALLEFAYVNVLLRQKSKKQDMPEENKRNDETDKGEDSKTSREVKGRGHSFIDCLTKPFKCEETDAAKRVDIISRYIFPLSFTLFLAIFFIVCGLAPAPESENS